MNNVWDIHQISPITPFITPTIEIVKKKMDQNENDKIYILAI